MELTKAEQAILEELWSDERKRNVIQKAFMIAAAGTPDVPVGNIHTILYSVQGLLPELEQDTEDKTSIK